MNTSHSRQKQGSVFQNIFFNFLSFIFYGIFDIFAGERFYKKYSIIKSA